MRQPTSLHCECSRLVLSTCLQKEESYDSWHASILHDLNSCCASLATLPIHRVFLAELDRSNMSGDRIPAFALGLGSIQ